MGRPPIGKKAMTGAERVRRHYAKHDEQLKAEATATLKAALKQAAAKIEVVKGLDSNEQRELERLKAENGELRQQVIALRREVADLQRAKPNVIQQPPRDETEEVAGLQRQLKAARTRNGGRPCLASMRRPPRPST